MLKLISCTILLRRHGVFNEASPPATGWEPMEGYCGMKPRENRLYRISAMKGQALTALLSDACPISNWSRLYDVVVLALF